MKDLYEYLNSYDTIPVSPIWGGRKAFEFLCLGHLEMSEAMGFELEQATSVLSVVKPGQVPDMDTLEKIIERGYFNYDIFDGELEALEYINEEFPDIMCGGGSFGPLTVVSGILGAENMLRLVLKKPAFVEMFASYVTEYVKELARRESEIGQDYFWIAEPVASLLSPARFERFSGKYLKQIYEAAGVPGFLHVCGRTDAHTSYMVKTGAKCLSIDYCTDIGQCIREVPDDVVVMGNINPSILRFGSADEVREEVRSVIRACGGFDNFVLSTGCVIMDGTTDSNMEIMFEEAELAGRRC